ncbi:MAG: polyphosphate kinase 1 [Eubacteriaceae bacterium]|jgi:polyphosphate kinase|nr:polyphosphate kinase 1 [Eubacteriaceae bacterium]
MAENVKPLTPRDISYTQHRELSWLKFNQRVLEEATDESVPLLERLKFISIFTSNLDEFFMVRVGSLFDLSVMTPDAIDNKTGQTPMQQLDAVFEAVTPLIEMKDNIYRQVSDALREAGIFDLQMDELTKQECKFVEKYYRDFVQPILSPQIIDTLHPFPHLPNKALHIASLLHDKNGRSSLGLIPVPASLPTHIHLPDQPDRFVRIETILLAYVSDIFGIYTPQSSNVIAVTRNADISFDEEKFDDDEDLDYRHHMSKLLKKRARLAPVRLEMQGENHELSLLLSQRLQLEKKQVFYSSCPLEMRYVFSLYSQISPHLLWNLIYPGYTPKYPSFLDPSLSMTSQIMQRDIFLHYPYDSMSPFLQLLKESAACSDVLSIKITIYRLALNSIVAQQLCIAAENGKDVTVLIELRARFDEAHNISWAERMEQAGCRIIYGMGGFKCHSKLCLITRKEKGQLKYITQVGTGNYNEKTSELYSDFSLMTANEAISQDAIAFFQNMLIGNLNGNYEHLLVSPVSMKASLIRFMDEEIRKGEGGRIIIKANSLTERDIIDKLAQASQAGVNIDLILRGICCIRPGIIGKTDQITVTSIVGRFLEHARVYCFGTGEDAKLYISSADMMTRNIIRRVEVACPVLDPAIKEWLLSFLDLQLKDTAKARMLLPDGNYVKKETFNAPLLDSQQWLMEHRPVFANSNALPKKSSSLWLRFKQFFQ